MRPFREIPGKPLYRAIGTIQRSSWMQDDEGGQVQVLTPPTILDAPTVRFLPNQKSLPTADPTLNSSLSLGVFEFHFPADPGVKNGDFITWAGGIYVFQGPAYNKGGAGIVFAAQVIRRD